MNGHSFFRHTLVVGCCALFFGIFFPAIPAEAFSDQVIQKGATGDDVVELQARLQYNGFYNGTIDGVFGWETFWSVKNFQEQFGLEPDGLVGDEMKAMLEKSTDYDEQFVKEALENAKKFTHYGDTPKEIQKGEKGSAEEEQRAQRGQRSPREMRQEGNNQKRNVPTEERQNQDEQPSPKQRQQTENDGRPPSREMSPEKRQSNQANIQKAMNVPRGFSENDIQIMANAVYGEARGEPYIGQVAVAAVIINRINSPIFPNTASGVIFEPRAFTAVADGQIYLRPDEQARKAVLDAINGHDPTGGALYYYNPEKATSGWVYNRPTIKRIGKHVFAK